MSPNGQENHGLFIEAADLTLGRQWARRDFRRVLSVRNVGTNTVSIARFQSSCNCATFSPTTLSIRPGETREVQLALDLTAFMKGVNPVAGREVEINVLAMVDGSSLPAHWRMTGTAISAVLAVPPRVTFAQGELNADDPPERIVRLTCKKEVADVSAECDARLAQVAIQPVGGENGVIRERRLSIQPANGLPLGALNFEVRLNVALRSGEKFEAAPIAVSGIVYDDLEMVPDEMLVVPAELGANVEDQVLISSRRGDAFTIDWIRADGHIAFNVKDPAELASAHVVGVRQTVDEVGLHSRIARVKTRNRDGRTKVRAFKMTRYGLARGGDQQ